MEEKMLSDAEWEKHIKRMRFTHRLIVPVILTVFVVIITAAVFTIDRRQSDPNRIYWSSIYIRTTYGDVTARLGMSKTVASNKFPDGDTVTVSTNTLDQSPFTVRTQPRTDGSEVLCLIPQVVDGKPLKVFGYRPEDGKAVFVETTPELCSAD